MIPVCHARCSNVGLFQSETCPPFLPQTCHAVMPHLSPHPFRVKLHHGRRHGCRCNRWLVHCNMAGFMAMLISVGIHNPRRNPTWRWTSVFAMIAVAQPTKNGYEVSPKWIYGKKVPHGDFCWAFYSTNVPIGSKKKGGALLQRNPVEPPRMAKIQSKESKATFTNTNNGLDTPPQQKLSK